MQPDAILAARDLGRVGATLDDGGDDNAVARHPWLGRDDDAVADAEPDVGGEARVYGDGAWRVLRDATRDGAWRVLRVATRYRSRRPLRVGARGLQEQR